MFHWIRFWQKMLFLLVWFHQLPPICRRETPFETYKYYGVNTLHSRVVVTREVVRKMICILNVLEHLVSGLGLREFIVNDSTPLNTFG